MTQEREISTPTGRPWRVGVLGDTGRGDYGHQVDVACAGMPGLEVVTVADPDAAGRAAAAARTGAARAYADYREMLAVAEDREPLASGAGAAAALEMIMAAYAAHFSGRRVPLPLARRDHPLSAISAPPAPAAAP